MSDRSNLCYIIDYQRNYYRTDDNNQLVMAESKEAAEVFSHEEANERINKGRKPKFYATIDATESKPKGVYDNMEEIDWLGYLSTFRFVVASLDKYKAELNEALSQVDMKICDIMHYVELYDVCEQENAGLIQLLKECRMERRRIKDEWLCADYFQNSIGTSQNAGKAKEAMKQIKKLDSRHYTPRQLPELFEDKPESGNDTAAMIQMTHEEIALKRKEDTMEYTKQNTVYDGKNNDWREFAKKQVEFYGSIKQYISNQHIRVEELDARIEDALQMTENANYNVAQAYKVLKMLKDLRNERKAILTELQYLEEMVSYFDCEAMHNAYSYCLELIERSVAPDAEATVTETEITGVTA